MSGWGEARGRVESLLAATPLDLDTRMAYVSSIHEADDHSNWTEVDSICTRLMQLAAPRSHIGDGSYNRISWLLGFELMSAVAAAECTDEERRARALRAEAMYRKMDRYGEADPEVLVRCVKVFAEGMRLVSEGHPVDWVRSYEDGQAAAATLRS